MTDYRQFRISDQERDVAAAALGEHFAAGRLTHAEFEERTDRVWAARVWQDLDALFTDLPEPRVVNPAARRGVTRLRQAGPGPSMQFQPLPQLQPGFLPRPVARPVAFRPTPVLPLVLFAIGMTALLGRGFGLWPLLILAGLWFWGSRRLHRLHRRDRTAGPRGR